VYKHEIDKQANEYHDKIDTHESQINNMQSQISISKYHICIQLKQVVI
jgi:hypothetical protein